MENGKRVIAGFSDLHLGSFVDGGVSNSVRPLEISNSPSFVKHKTQILDECLSFVELIKSIKILEPSELRSEEEKVKADEKKGHDVSTIVRKDGSVLTPVNNTLGINLFKLQRVLIKEKDKEETITLCKEYLDVDISQDTEFFNIGNLEKKYDILSSYSYEGKKG